MTLIIACECGISLREESEEALVRAAEEHIRVAHPAVAGAAERDDLLAMAHREAEET
jgi:predicted small metal-binding protein